jgi:hypothetical protein
MPVREMVERAVRLVLDREELAALRSPVVLEPFLVVRSSTGPAPGPVRRTRSTSRKAEG